MGLYGGSWVDPRERQRLIQQDRSQRLWRAMEDDGSDVVKRNKELMAAAENIGPKPKKASMANTGAKGLAAILKSRQAKMLEKFSTLADEVNNQFDEQEKLLDQGNAVAEQLKSDAAELRDALGLKNDQ